jgi:hypothetical protein
VFKEPEKVCKGLENVLNRAFQFEFLATSLEIKLSGVLGNLRCMNYSVDVFMIYLCGSIYFSLKKNEILSIKIKLMKKLWITLALWLFLQNLAIPPKLEHYENKAVMYIECVERSNHSEHAENEEYTSIYDSRPMGLYNVTGDTGYSTYTFV